LHLVAQMAACSSQITNITPLAFYLFALTINRMLALLVFKKAKGTGSASNKALKSLPSVVRTQLRGAASPLCPTCLRPLLESYITRRIHA
jgi:hypothetical protein